MLGTLCSMPIWPHLVDAAGVWMDISRNTTNPFYQSIQAYTDQSTGAVSISTLARRMLFDTHGLKRCPNLDAEV
jgi:hypothetical protein